MEVKVPQLPESVTDATLVTWHRKVGEPIRRDENLVDLETDKVVLEVPAPANGVLTEIKQADGATVTSGEVLALFEPQELSAESEPAPAAESGAEPAAGTGAEPAAETGTESPAESAAATEGSAASAPEPSASTGEVAAEAGEAGRPEAGGAPRMGPAARKLVDQHDLDASHIAGTGRDGMLTKGDVLSYLATHSATNVGMEEAESDAEVTEPEAGPPAGQRREVRVGMTRLRQRIAERLVEAQQTSAMLTTFNEADMSAIVALRKKYQEPFQSKYDIKLGFMSFFVRASIEALRAFPMLNASVDGSEIVYHEFFDVGVAVSTDRGLIVPVLRNADSMSFGEIESEIRDFGMRARSGDIGMEELTGGTFTITNGGIFGSMMSTPILNPPQSGILGMHAIQDRPVVIDGEIVVRPMMYLALTYDHRIVDGREAVQFLVHLKQQLEDPARLALQI
jgi:2-oxoglutarate dehydrogenase E2 component (dihydrolipoamide succinyltransferase)